MNITVGETYTVTDAAQASHFLEPGTEARVIQDNSHPASKARAAIVADRWLCRGTSAQDGGSIVQWLTAADLTD